MFVVLALAVALFVFVMGAWGVFAPGSIFAFISGWSSKTGFWLAVLLRLCFGLALWFAAPDTRLPMLLRGLGALAIVMARYSLKLSPCRPPMSSQIGLPVACPSRSQQATSTGPLA